MTSERQQQIENLMREALKRDESDRARFLEHSCADDRALRQEVEAMMAATQPSAGSGKAPVSPDLATISRQVSRYQVLSLLGKGGMGEVYLAQDLRLKRKVALKMLPVEFTQDAGRVRRFEQEAIAISALNHPNIVTIHEIGEEAGDRFIAMEYVQGQPLRAMMGEPLKVESIAQLGGQIARALSVAHAAGITHRDIKPENIMVRTDGYVKVLDFGLARLSPTELDKEAATLQGTRTMPGVVLGTVRYMSPEQARGETAGSASDIFSLGLIFYEMATGQHPIESASLLGMLNAIANQPLAPPSQLHAGISAALESLIMRMLEKDPHDRPTAAEVDAELDLLLEAPGPRRVSPISATNLRETQLSGMKIDAERTRVLQTNTAAAATIREKGSRGRGVAIAAAATLLVAAAGFAAWFVRAPRKAPAAPPPARISLLTSYPGSEREPSFSPDGKRIAFIWDGGSENNPDATDIYVSLLGVGDPLRLTTAPATDYKPVWSPTGDYIAFLRRQARGIERVMLVPSMGGKEQVVAEAAGGLDWSPDGKWLAIVRAGEPDHYFSIFLLNLETKEARRITQPQEGALRDDFPAFSPDGKTVAFVRNVSSAVTELFTVSTTGEGLRQITFDKRNVLSVCWTSDGKQLIFASDRSGKNTLWKLPATGGTPEPLSSTGSETVDVASARQGDRLACTQESTDTSIYQINLGENGASAKNRKWTKLIFSSRAEHSPMFSPDGRQIVFVSKRSGSPEIWISDDKGQHPAQLTRFGGPQTGSAHWSPSGQEIAFDSRPEGQADIFVISAQGGKPRQITADKALDVTPSWSGDGKWIYFSSNRTGERQIWKAPAAGGPAIQITRKGGFEPIETPDGKYIIYAKGRDIPGIWRIPVAGGEEEAIPELATAGYHRYWSVTSTGIFFVPQEVLPRPVINFYNFATRRVTLTALPEKPPIYGPSGMSVSPDGRRLLYAQPTQIVSDINLVENFR